MAQRPLENLRILESVSKTIFEFGEGMFVDLHADMLLRPGHHLPNPGEADVDLLTVGARPVHPGAVAALTDLPVVGLPLDVGPLRGVDALYAIAQLPPGCPVGTVGIGNAKNAALLALRILGR